MLCRPKPKHANIGANRISRLACSSSRRSLSVFIALSVAALVCGCVAGEVNSVQTKRFASPPAHRGSVVNTKKKLVKPTIGESDMEARIKQARLRAQSSMPKQPATYGAKRTAQSDARRQRWEDQIVKSAGIEKAKAYPSVKKIKVCYEPEFDEWWVTLFDDVGQAIDLKQYVWDRETRRLELFLVQKQIPLDKLEAEAERKESGRACEAFDPPFSTTRR